MKRSIYVSVLVLALAFIANAQSPSGLKVEDLFRFKRVSDPQISPDGRLVAYSITSYDREKNSRSSQIWIIPADGGEPRQLTSAPRANERPRWSHDGKQIAFISTRDGASQIWVVDVNGGEARKLTTISTEA